MKYQVLVDDNFHFMDEDERTEAGSYDTVEDAIEAAKKIVVDCLRSEYKEGMTPDKLYDYYTTFGDDPFVYPGEGEVHFSAWDFAKSICAEICEEQSKLKRED